LPEFKRLGYQGAFGCEYRPTGSTEDGLSWRDPLFEMENEIETKI
jgi:hydroxypyruvate isomerase